MIDLFATLPRSTQVYRPGQTIAVPYISTHTVRLKVVDADLSPVDLTGAACSLRIRPDVGQTLLTEVVLTGGMGAAQGEVTGSWAMSAFLYPGQYVYDVWGTVAGEDTQIIPLSILMVLASTR